MEIKTSTVAAMPATLHDANLAVLDAALGDMTGGEADDFAGGTMDWNQAASRPLKLHNLFLRGA